jgi:sarcosine oxidase, subunit alpha
LSPLVELAQQAGCPLHYVPEMGGWVPVHSDRFETPQPGLFIAGSISGVEGAGVAEIQGRIAGLAAAAYLKLAARQVLERDIHKQQEDIINARRSAIPFIPKSKRAGHG